MIPALSLILGIISLILGLFLIFSGLDSSSKMSVILYIIFGIILLCTGIAIIVNHINIAANYSNLKKDTMNLSNMRDEFGNPKNTVYITNTVMAYFPTNEPQFHLICRRLEEDDPNRPIFIDMDVCGFHEQEERVMVADVCHRSEIYFGRIFFQKSCEITNIGRRIGEE
jgi:hypothetical protein